MIAGSRLIRRAPVRVMATYPANEPYWRASNHFPAVAINRYGTPVLVGEIEIHPAGMLSDTYIDRPLGSVKLRARFEQIECRPDHRGTCCRPGRPVITVPHPVSETLAANGPRFPVAICYEVGISDPARSVKHLLT